MAELDQCPEQIEVAEAEVMFDELQSVLMGFLSQTQAAINLKLDPADRVKLDALFDEDRKALEAKFAESRARLRKG